MDKMTQTLLNADNIQNAWKKLKNDKAPWQPGVSAKEFKENHVLYLLKLSEEIKSKSYKPELLRRFAINKADGKKRLLSALTLKDKFAQRLVLQTIEADCETLFSPASFAYRPGRNRFQAVNVANSYIRSGLHWVVDADIKQFFDSIPHKQLKKQLQLTIKNKDILKLMDQWLEISAYPGHIFQAKKGIPQGGILSPIWCNIYLNQLDQYFTKNNIPFVRFADDFLIFTKTQKQAQHVLKKTTNVIEKLGLECHPDKTKIHHCNDKVKYLGLTLSDDKIN